MANGWVKLHRLTLEKNIFKDAYTFQVFTYLMLKAAYKEMSIKVGNRNIDLAPGQLLYGRKSVAEKLGMGETKLRGIMKYLVRNGSIAIESYSKYSIVTIVNWAQYQWGEVEPEFPFDIDFLDDADGNEEVYGDYADYENDYEEIYTEEVIEEYAETQPANNRVQMQAQTDFQDCDDEFLTSREPQYNNINKYKNNNIIKNKTKEKNKKIKEEKTKKENKHIENPKNISNIQNIKPQNHSYRQNPSSVNELARFSALDTLPKVAGLECSQEMLYPGGGISKGKVGFVDSANRSGFTSSSGAFAAPAACSSGFDDDEYLDARLLFDVDF